LRYQLLLFLTANIITSKQSSQDEKKGAEKNKIQHPNVKQNRAVQKQNKNTTPKHDNTLKNTYCPAYITVSNSSCCICQQQAEKHSARAQIIRKTATTFV